MPYTAPSSMRARISSLSRRIRHRWLWCASELDAALLADRSLLDCVHLAPQPCEFRRVLLVPLDKKCRRPEDDYGRGSRHGVLGRLRGSAHSPRAPNLIDPAI